jgi:hypothetical protein
MGLLNTLYRKIAGQRPTTKPAPKTEEEQAKEQELLRRKRAERRAKESLGFSTPSAKEYSYLSSDDQAEIDRIMGSKPLKRKAR